MLQCLGDTNNDNHDDDAISRRSSNILSGMGGRDVAQRR
jgi:hypothetical protein